MQLKLTIKREKKGIVWGHVFFMENLLVDWGRSVDEVQAKLRATLANYYELKPHSFGFLTETASYGKARRMVNRLKKNNDFMEPEVSFNSRFFV